MSNAAVYQMVTDRIIAQMEAGIIPWLKPWHSTGERAVSRSTGKPYSFINQLLLPRPGEYATFKQINEAGGKVRKGEKSSTVIFWKQIKVTEKNTETGEPEEKLVPVLRYYQVFNLDQCENITPKYYREPEPTNADPIEEAEAVITGYVSRSGLRFENTSPSNEAYYSPSRDRVVVPMLTQYENPAEYYSTTFHELTHSTGHSSRLNRFTTDRPAAFGSTEYSKEELTAELGSCYLMAHCGINSDTTERNSAGYLQSWLKALKNDKSLIVGAASRAEKAAALILDEQ